MSFLDKAKDTINQAVDQAKEKVGPLAEQAKERGGEFAERAGEYAAKGVDAAASGIDKATGGRFHDKIEDVSNSLETKLDPDAGTDGPIVPGTDPRP